MEFKQFSDSVNAQFGVLSNTGKLFRSKITGDQLWDVYISSFKKGDDPIFRDPNSTSHTCNLDKAFIRRYGNVVALVNNEIITMWDVEIDETSKYYNSVMKMSEMLKKAPIVNVFFESFHELDRNLNYGKVKKSDELFRLGVESNFKTYTPDEASLYGVVESGKVYKFNYFYTDLKTQFVEKIRSVEAVMGDFRSDKDVFKRGLDEISLDTLTLVRDLIKQGSILDGTSHLYKVDAMIDVKKVYNDVPTKDKDNWCWENSYKFQFAKFRNELIGTLCTELTEGKELNEAIRTWNKRVDPANYMKAVAPITETQKKEAEKFVIENGYIESFNRRFATIEDINVNEIIHSNVGDGKVKSASIFDNVKTPSSQHKRSEFNKVEEITIDKFMSDVLPSATSVEAFVENKMTGNFVTLTTSAENSKPIFKWDNPFSWTFNGNLAGKSQIKEAVKTAGGKVDGVLRFSIMWADGNGDDSDLDAHCTTPNKHLIYYASKYDPITQGTLDVDIQHPHGRLAVENITFPDVKHLRNGKYTFKVNQYSARQSKGFRAEIEFNGEVYQYEYNKGIGTGDNVNVAVVEFKNGVFTIEHKLPETNSSKTIWNVETNKFHKVNLVCTSPNHWGDNNVGNKHFMFMIDGCKTDQPIRTFHNENLNSELVAHRKVLDVLGSTNSLDPANKQLSGLGFNATVREDLIVRVKGSHQRVMKIKF